MVLILNITTIITEEQVLLILEQKILNLGIVLKQNSIDLYASLKSLYLQNRKQKIANSTSAVETQNDSDWEEIDTN